jgi:phosphatidylglycerol:prolipoprotein diacylglycerol transferase
MKIFEVSIFGLNLAPSYYGLMYILGFLYGIWALKKSWNYTKDQRESLFLYIFLGVILWGRLWYVLFYNLSYYIATPLEIFAVWNGGMSFHGGLLGVIVAASIFSRKEKTPYLRLADDLALIAPVWIFFGRIWNYLNKELLWFPYNGFFAVETSAGSFFPSPLVEALLEWVVLFCLVQYIFSRKSSYFYGKIAASFLILYAVFRAGIELFIRSPDAHIGYALWALSRGFLLSGVMIFFGVLLYFLARKKYAK